MNQLSNSPKTVVSAKGLYKVFGNQVAVNRIDFEVYRGECLGLLGPNGAGKTTTLRMLLGVAIPDAGSLTVLDYSLPRQARLMRTRIGVVPQQDNLDPDLSVIENLFTYARYFGVKRRAIKQRISELLEFTALTAKQHATVRALSGGMQRRLVLARALLNQPELIVLDEPTTGLDPQARQLIWQRLRTLKREGATLILTTHYMEEAERLCDRILLINQGIIIAQGKPRELIAEYIEPVVLEIHGEAADAWYEKHKSSPDKRLERVGETLFCYCRDDKTLLEELDSWPTLKVFRRPGNLEDVFIKLTGRGVE